MKAAKISKQTEKLFSPVFRAMIGGKQVSVTLNDFKQNWQKYVNSDIGYLYENRSELIADLGSISKKKEAVVVDMNKGTRGTAFNQKESEKEMTSEVSKMLSEQLERRSRIKNRFQKNQEKAKAKALKAEKTKAAAEKAAAEKAAAEKAAAEKAAAEKETKAKAAAKAAATKKK